ncbi:DNA polymerase III subunit gamma/tau [Plasticicumulans sp.]|uniref:DNA polymerase III subunit gamma/tau n=1 Tax=Plasticicumulans sp. TaxID=2307179 RepID=UPI003942282C
MSHQVLARKWRPKRFAELVGQEHVVRALGNALANGRLHHAFLFTGTRGVGKTTIARILAKSLNCETGITAEPCGVCAACREIDEGRFVDLIEVDAASRTKVEDTRELLENVQYAPARGRYKVYLIDEVHMLSTSSFNALLKTLEEPPPHVKFLLATTDPQKLPVTVLSRCLQFSLKRLPAALIQSRLADILDAEGIAHEPAALAALARAGDGSMRDALSLLDQAIAFGAGRVGALDTAAMLGTIDRLHVVRLAEALAGGDAASVLAVVEGLDREAPDYDGVLAELLSLLQRVALAQAVPGASDELYDSDTLVRLASAFTAEDVQLCYQIALHARRDLPLAPEPRGGFEMALLRMLCFRPATLPGASGSGEPPRPAAATASRPAPPRSGSAAPGPATTALPAPEATPATAPAGDPAPAATGAGRGRSMLKAVLGRPAAGDTAPARPAAAPPVAAATAPAASPAAVREPLPEPPVTDPPRAEADTDTDTGDAPPPWLDESPPWDDAALPATLDDGPDIAVAAPPRATRRTAATAAPAPSPAPAPAAARPAAVAPPPPAVVPAATAAAPEAVPAAAAVVTDALPDWPALVARLPVKGRPLQLARHAVLEAVQHDRWTLALDPAHASLQSAAGEQKLAEALASALGRPVTLVLRVGAAGLATPARAEDAAAAGRRQAAIEAFGQNPAVRALVETLDARIRSDSITPGPAAP